MKNKLLNKIKNMSGWADLLYSLFAIVVAFIIGAILIKVSGYSVKTAYTTLFNGAFGSTYNFTQTLVKTIPLIFTGLAVAIGFQSGLLNIGAEGQLYWGAFATTIIILIFPGLPALLLIPLGIIVGALAGGTWAAVPGYLKAKTGAHEVVTTIMFNYIATLGTTFLVKNYFKEAGPVDQTEKIVEKARLPELMANTDLSWAIFIGIATVVVISYLLNRTSLGYDIKAVGNNASAAEYGGINSKRITVITMAISGAVAGLAGSMIVMGVLHRFITNFSPGYGFTGIAVAVMGKNRPWGVLLAALLFGALEAGGMQMQLFAKIPKDLMTVVQGLVILFVAAPSLYNVITGVKDTKEVEV